MSPQQAETYLRNAIKDTKVVFVVGTGVSIAASCGHKQASWKGLLQHGLNKVQNSKGNGKEERNQKARAAAYQTILNAGPTTHDFIGAASLITDAMGGINSPTYAKWLEKTVGNIKPKKREILDALRSLRKAKHCLATTNYDDLLLEAHEGLTPITWKSANEITSTQRLSATDNIIYLHGHWKTAHSVVLGRGSYDDVTRDLEYRDKLKTFWESRIWVYVGCGMDGLNDPDFGMLLTHHGKAARDAKHWDLCLVKESDLIPFNKYFEDSKLNIAAVSYGKDRSDLAGYLDSLVSPYKSILKEYATTVQNKFLNLKDSSIPSTASIIDLPLEASFDASTSAASAVKSQNNGKTGGDPPVNSGITSRISMQVFTGMVSGPRAAGVLKTREQIGICKIRDFLKPGSRTIILGEPGCGKSTLLEIVTRFYASKHAPTADHNDELYNALDLPQKTWLPVLIQCRDLDWSKVSVKNNYKELLLEHAGTLQYFGNEASLIFDGIDDLLKKNEVLFLVDGLDEICLHKRRSFAKLISHIANKYDQLTIIITSRIVNFEKIEPQFLSSSFKQAHVAELSNDMKKDFVKKWSEREKWDSARRKKIINFVCDSTDMGTLAGKILFLNSIVQNSDIKLPKYEAEVYSNTVNWMIKRMGDINQNAENPLTAGELTPYLNFLAYKMRRNEHVEILKKSAESYLQRLQKSPRKNDILVLRNADELLAYSVDPIGLLVPVKKQTEDLFLRFYHRSFQEYFLKCHFEGSKKKPARSILVENEFSDSHQETLRQLVANLPEQEVGDALMAILSVKRTPMKEARERSAFALKRLSEQAAISETAMGRVFDAAIKNLNDKDCSSSEDKTLMDRSLTAVGKSAFAGHFRKHLTENFLAKKGTLRTRAGLAYLKIVECDVAKLNDEQIEATLEKCHESFRASNASTRVGTALFLTRLFYLRGGKLAGLNAHHRNRFLDMLMSGLSSDPATIAASMWALVWFTGAAIRVGSPKRQRECVTLQPSQMERVKNLLCSDLWDEVFCPRAVLLMTRDARVSPVGAQLNWIDKLALVADGKIARRDRALPNRPPQGQEDSVDWLLPFLGTRYSQKTNIYAAIALGYLSVFRPEMGKALWTCLADSTHPDDLRDEALVYLAFIGDDYSRTMIESAADTVPTDKDDYLYTRGVFGLLLMDDADLLAKQLSKCLPHADLTAYAYCLAGSRDARGLELLTQFESDRNSRIATVAKLALSTQQMSNQRHHERIESGDFKMTSLLSFVESVKLRTSKLVMTYRARDENGRDFFAYIFCDRDGIIRMKRSYRELKSTAAKDFGEVLYEDYRKDPDDRARAFLKKWLEENGGEIL